jgi:hypothetical protein
MWCLINETGNSQKSEQVVINRKKKIIIDPQEISAILSTFFIENVEALLTQNNVSSYG